MSNWDGKTERRRSQVRCQDEVFEKIADLEDRFRAVEKQVIILVSALESEKGSVSRIMYDISEMIKAHQETIHGDGTRNNIGNCSRITFIENDLKERKEDEDKKSTQFIGMLIAIGLIVIKSVLDLFTGK